MLKTTNLCKFYTEGGKTLKAVNDVTIEINKGDFCALVGESGSGKSTLSKLLPGIIAPDSGKVTLEDRDISLMIRENPRQVFSKIQLVLQDSKSSLNPYLSVFDSIAEPMQTMTRLSKDEIKARVSKLMEQMELPSTLINRKAHELSGGQQQRVCLARALSAEPDYIIFDEVVSGLDVISRKTVLDLLREIQRRNDAGYLFITHDIDAALYLANKIFVMKNGQIVESLDYKGDTSSFTHPYSKLLLGSLPQL